MELSEVVLTALRQGFLEFLQDSGLLEEVDWEGALVDAIIRFLESDDDAEKLRERLRSLLRDIDEKP